MTFDVKSVLVTLSPGQHIVLTVATLAGQLDFFPVWMKQLRQRITELAPRTRRAVERMARYCVRQVDAELGFADEAHLAVAFQSVRRALTRLVLAEEPPLSDQALLEVLGEAPSQGQVESTVDSATLHDVQVSEGQHDVRRDLTLCLTFGGVQASEFSHYILKSWEREGFRLKMYDTYRRDARGKRLLAYELFDDEFGPEPVFRGADFHLSPLYSDDSDAAVADLLGYLSLRPGDTDAEHFADYSPEQLDWCQRRGEALSLVAESFEQRHRWHELHESGNTREAVLTVAYHGEVEDLFEVLGMDIFETYDVVEQLCYEADADPILPQLLRELHRRRNIEIVGGEENLHRFYGQ